MFDSGVSVSPLDHARDAGPLLVQANTEMPNGAHWVAQHREALLQVLLRHGGVVLRGFRVPGSSEFEATVAPLVDEWMGYRDRASKRSALAGRVMTSTDTPPAFTIEQHCESSFTSRWPRTHTSSTARSPQRLAGGRR